MSQAIEKNVSIRKTAESFVDLGIDYATEDGIDDADGMRHFWQCVIEKACQVIGDDNPSEELQRWKDEVAKLKSQKRERSFVPSDDDPFPWGKYGPDKGDPRTYGGVPADYYAYLDSKGCDDPRVAAYIEEHF